jgi:glycosyltransferase involved in cell wall biosynthesis
MDKSSEGSDKNSAAGALTKNKKGLLSRSWKAVRDRLLPRKKKKVGFAGWVEKYDTLSKRDRKAIRRHLASLGYHPKISVVMPAYQSNEQWFREAIDSVRAQLYQNWELCVADDASPSNGVEKILKRYAAKDSRIKWTRRAENGHISAATNSALRLAEGEFVALMDHDDILPEHALYEVVVELNEHPDADLIYSDEDKIDERRRRFGPYFKTDWNPERFLGQNIFSHLGVYRRSIIEKVGGMREGMEGSQDYDLALRASRETVRSRIRHIPAILYHWRRPTEENTSFSQRQLEKCVDAARRAKIDHLRALGEDATVEPAPELENYCDRIRRKVPEPAPLVSLIVPTKNAAHLLRPCLDGLLHRTDYANFEIIVIDHESDEQETIALLQEAARDPRVRVMPYQGEFNYSDMNNKAVALARGELIGLVNNDIDVIAPDWLTEMVSLAIRPENGAVGAKLLYPDGRVQHAGVIVGLGGGAGHIFATAQGNEPGYFGCLQLTSNFTAVTGACLVVRKSLFQEVGGLNAVDLKVAFNDVDLCLKIAARGYLNVWTPHALLYHHESPSRGLDHEDPVKNARSQREVAYVRSQWGQVLDNDPFFNPNFSVFSRYCELAAPPRRIRPWIKWAKAP